VTDWLNYKRDRKIKLSTQIDYEHMIDRMKKVFEHTLKGRRYV
jgi:hypothetical protein